MISGLNFYGNWSKAGNRYTEVDVKLLKNEKAQNRLASKFENCGHDIDFHFYKGPKSNWNNSLVGPQSAEWVSERYGINIEPNDDRLSVLITSNIGSPKYPLTPWIIAHRISHALWQKVGHAYYWRIMSRWDQVGINMYSKWFGCAIGTMRSCRNRTLARNGELFHELFAQLMLTGKVGLNRIENRVFVRNQFRNPQYRHFSDAQVEAINWSIDILENSVYNIHHHLHEMYGEIIVV